MSRNDREYSDSINAILYYTCYIHLIYLIVQVNFRVHCQQPQHSVASYCSTQCQGTDTKWILVVWISTGIKEKLCSIILVTAERKG